MNLLLIPKGGGKGEQIFEHNFWPLEETNLWSRKMGKKRSDGEPGAGADALGGCGGSFGRSKTENSGGRCAKRKR